MIPALCTALNTARDTLRSGGEPLRGDELAALDAVLAARSGTSAGDPDHLAAELVSFAAQRRADPVALADALAVAARLLAARADDTELGVFAALLIAIGQLGAGTGAHPVPLSLGAPVLAALAAEAELATRRIWPGRDGEQL